MDSNTKVCSGCKIEYSKEFYCKHSGSKDGLSYLCRICRCKINKEYTIKNRVKINLYKLNWAIKNKEKVKLSRNECLKKNKYNYKEKQIEYIKKYSRKIKDRNIKYRTDLLDPYIKKLITKSGVLKAKEVPRELIEATRENIKIKRFLNKTSGRFNVRSKNNR